MKVGKWLGIVLVAFLLLGLVGTAWAEPAPMAKVLIGFRQQPGPAEQAVVQRAGGNIKYTYRLVPAIAATVPQAAIAGLLANPNVTTVEMDIDVHAVDAELDNTWGVKRIDAGTVHNNTNMGAGVKVAVIDSGIDYKHPELADNYKGGYDFVNKDNDPMDDNGHGTHVAGTVAAKKDGNGVVGVAPEASLHGLKVLSAGGGGSYSDVIAALQWSVDNGIQVTNNSYGSSGDPGSTVKAAFDNSTAAGILHIAAAGNSGNPGGKGDNVIYPARWSSVIAVGATTQSDSRASYSSTGPEVELAAPGHQVNSTKMGGGYTSMSGTSMASPHVAGTAALVIAAGITGASEVRQTLADTAVDLGAAGRDNQFGFGLVNAATAVGATPAPPPAVETGSIAGKVTNAADGSAIAGATVSVAGTDKSASSGDTGDYLIEGVAAGTYKVTASADGFNSASQDVTVMGNETATGDFALTATGPGAAAATVASVTYTTNGGNNSDRHLHTTVTLKDDTGDSVAGASVSIILRNTSNGSSWSSTGTTGTSGTVTFSLNNAPAGCYTTEVTNVAANGLTWDGATPANGHCK